MADIKGALTKQVGPLPVFVWILVVGGGLGIGLYARRATAARSSAIPDETTSAGGTIQDMGAVNTSTQPSTGNAVNGLGKPIFDTNEAWRLWAAGQLIARGYSPVAVDRALRKYLNSEALSQQEQALVDTAIQYAGVTPQILPPPQSWEVTDPNPPNTDETTPPTTPPTVPPAIVPAITPTQTAAPSFSPSQPPVSTLVELLAPSTAVQVNNPITGDGSYVAIGRTSDGPGYIYGGNKEQVELLTGRPAVENRPAQAVAPPLTLEQKYDLIRAAGLGQYLTPQQIGLISRRSYGDNAATAAQFLNAEQLQVARLLGNNV